MSESRCSDCKGVFRGEHTCQPSARPEPERSGWSSLRYAVEGDEVVIRIGIETLKQAAELSEAFNPFNDKRNDFDRWDITDTRQFAEDFCREIRNDEAEDGSTALIRAMDDAALRVIEGGGSCKLVRKARKF